MLKGLPFLVRGSTKVDTSASFQRTFLEKQGKPAFPAEPASLNLQSYGLQLFAASSIILFLLNSVPTVFCLSVTWRHL